MVTRRDQRGVALIFVLWLLVLLGVIIAEVASKARAEAALLSSLRSRTVARYAAESGILAATVTIERLLDSTPNPLERASLFRQLEARLASLTEVELGGARFGVAALDLNARIDLNRADAATLHGLFGQFTSDARADTVAAALKAAPIRRLAELSRVPGIDDSLALAVAPYVTVWSDGLVNINSAPEPVLAALPGLAAAAPGIVARRHAGPERTPHLAVVRVGDAEAQILEATALFAHRDHLEGERRQRPRERWRERAPLGQRPRRPVYASLHDQVRHGGARDPQGRERRHPALQEQAEGAGELRGRVLELQVAHPGPGEPRRVPASPHLGTREGVRESVPRRDSQQQPRPPALGQHGARGEEQARAERQGAAHVREDPREPRNHEAQQHAEADAAHDGHERRVQQRRAHLGAELGAFLQVLRQPIEHDLERSAGLAGRDHRNEQWVEVAGVPCQGVGQARAFLDRAAHLAHRLSEPVMTRMLGREGERPVQGHAGTQQRGDVAGPQRDGRPAAQSPPRARHAVGCRFVHRDRIELPAPPLREPRLARIRLDHPFHRVAVERRGLVAEPRPHPSTSSRVTRSTSSSVVIPAHALAQPAARSGAMPCACASARTSASGARLTTRARCSSLIRISSYHPVRPR